MQKSVYCTDAQDAELIELLSAISLVSKRLATNLSRLAKQSQKKKGEKSYGQNERTITCNRRTT